jgi:N utilization substance protein A
VKRIEGQDIIYDLGKAEARCPKREQSRLEQFSIGERVRVVLLKVDRAAKGPQVIVSRAAPELVQNLFQSEVPEIYDNTVTIRAIAREAGERTKIAVQSRDKDVDPVGACVGMKGMRVQSIIRELRGEKIDIIEYSDDPVVFATHALSPAKVSKISIVDAVEKQMEVIVDDSQLSLAIGKKGQNVRLAAKLLGWKIDIKSEEEKRQEVETQMAAMVAPGAPVSVLIDYGLAEKTVEKLLEAGIGTIEKLGGMTPEQLEEIQGIGPKGVEKIFECVNAYYAQFEQPGEAGGGQPAVEEAATEPAGLEPGADTEAAAPTEAEPAAETEAAAPNVAEPAEVEPEAAALEAAESEQFDTIEDAGSPTHNQPGAGPEALPGDAGEGAPENHGG